MEFLIPIIVIAAVVVLFIILFVASYVKAPPDTAYIITGLGKRKVLIGTAGIRIPFLQRIDKLKLSIISVDVKTAVPVPTKEFINVTLDGVVTMQVARNEAEIDGKKVNLLDVAAKNFLNQREDYFIKMVTPVLEGNAREIIGQMGIKEMVNDRKAFAEKVRENASTDLQLMGIELLTFNVQNFKDDNGVIEALGTENEVQVKQTAAIAKAESEREIKKAQAAAMEASRAAEVAAETNIAEKENELAIRKSELQREADTKRAEAEAAYSIQEQEQRKTVEIATVNADIARREKEADLAEREINLKERRLDAEIKKVADAEKYKTEQEAAADLIARQHEVDAEKYEQEKRAEAMKIQAEAELVKAQREADAKKYEIEQQAEAMKAQAEAELIKQQKEAEGIRAKGLAEAEAIAAKGKAEAEAIDKKAEAMKKYEGAAVLEMLFGVLPEMAAAVTKPLENVDRITMFGDGNTTKLTGEMVNNITQILEGIQESTGLNVPQLLAGFMTGKAVGTNAENSDD